MPRPLSRRSPASPTAQDLEVIVEPVHRLAQRAAVRVAAVRRRVSNRVTVTLRRRNAREATASRSATSTSSLIGASRRTSCRPARSPSSSLRSRAPTRGRGPRASASSCSRSSTSHRVPTTVAALCLPFVWNLPSPSPHRRRFFFFLAARLACDRLGSSSFSTSVRIVVGATPLVWPSRKMPAQNSAVAVPPESFAAATRVTWPLRRRRPSRPAAAAPPRGPRTRPRPAP